VHKIAMAAKYTISEQSVFLNVPYDESYEDKFVALVMAIVALGRVPRCVAQIPSVGQGRLDRTLELMESCKVSIHDLSYVGLPVRFNMPFELGLAYALNHCAKRSTRKRQPYQILVLEQERNRLDLTLSDWDGIDPAIHNGDPMGVIMCILGHLRRPGKNPSPDEVYKLRATLWEAAQKLKRDYGQKDIFSPFILDTLVDAAIQLAQAAGMISP
jgi:hypothetical protein